MNVIKFKTKTKNVSSTTTAKSNNLLNLKLQLMANITDMIYVADEEYKDLEKGHTMKCVAPNTGNVYIITITRVETHEE